MNDNKCILKLPELRIEAGLNITELAEVSGVSRPYLSEIESCKYMPTVDVCCKLCKGLKVTPNEMIREEYYR